MLLSVLLVAVGLGYIAVWWPSSRTVGDLVTRGYAGWLAMLFIGGVLVFVGNMMEEDY